MAALPVKLLLVFCALQLLLITSVTACENDSTDASGDESVEVSPVCDYCLTSHTNRTKLPGQAIIIRAQNKFGVLEKSAHQTTVRKWRVRCPAGHEVHALVEGIQLRTNEYVQLNNQKYVYNESCMCNRSTPLPYFTKHGSVLVTLFAHHQQAATRVHYICLGKDSNSEIIHSRSTALLSCKQVVKYALKDATFGKLAQLILDPMAFLFAFRDTQHCNMLKQASAHCRFNVNEITCRG